MFIWFYELLTLHVIVHSLCLIFPFLIFLHLTYFSMHFESVQIAHFVVCRMHVVMTDISVFRLVTLFTKFPSDGRFSEYADWVLTILIKIEYTIYGVCE